MATWLPKGNVAIAVRANRIDRAQQRRFIVLLVQRLLINISWTAVLTDRWRSNLSQPSLRRRTSSRYADMFNLM
jgi:hypothetical protein